MNIFLGIALFALAVFALSWMSTFGAAMLTDFILDRQYGKQGSTCKNRRVENSRAIAMHLGA
jgi:hypothetical protein